MAGISHDLQTPLFSIQGSGHYRWSAEELQEMGKGSTIIIKMPLLKENA
ncbi:MAG: hypothetical protein ACI35R_12310 [Bacillus sp. (in: firmicutes)]